MFFLSSKKFWLIHINYFTWRNKLLTFISTFSAVIFDWDYGLAWYILNWSVIWNESIPALVYFVLCCFRCWTADIDRVFLILKPVRRLTDVRARKIGNNKYIILPAISKKRFRQYKRKKKKKSIRNHWTSPFKIWNGRSLCSVITGRTVVKLIVLFLFGFIFSYNKT